MMNEAMVREVFADEGFVKSLFAMETPEEVQTALRGKDVELSVEEIIKIKNMIVKKMESGEELSEEELEGVAGGFLDFGLSAVAIISIIGIAGLLAGGGAVIGGGIAGGAWATDALTGGKW